jgi:cell division protease FtsH
MVYGQKEELVFLGREIGEQRDYSDAVAEEIDEEVRRLVGEAYEEAQRILNENRETLDAIAQNLIEVETLDAAQFAAFFAKEASEVSDTPTPPKGKSKPAADAEDDRPSPSLDSPPQPALA